MEGQIRGIIRDKIVDALAAPVPPLTRRDVRLPGIPGKAIAVIGMRRTGKTTFLWQVLGDRLAQGTGREGLLYFNFKDERLYLQLVLGILSAASRVARPAPGGVLFRRDPVGAGMGALHAPHPRY